MTGRERRSRLREAHPEIEVAQWGDAEAVFLFDPDRFDFVAEHAKPKNKPGPRRLSVEQSAALVAAGRAHQFQVKSTGDKDTLCDRGGQETVAL